MIAEKLRESFQDSVIFYDGDCIYCQKYTEFIQLRENVGPVQLVDLRGQPDIAKLFKSDGIDVDEGMVFLYGNAVHHGSDAVHILAQLSVPQGVAGRLNKMVFRSAFLSAVLYPFLKAGRRATLFLRGKTLING